MLVISNDLSRIPERSNDTLREYAACQFKRFKNILSTEEAVKRLKEHGLDVEVVHDRNNDLIWLFGGKPPRNDQNSWDCWYWMATPTEESDHRWVAMTYKDRDYKLYPDLSTVLDHVLNSF